MIERIRHAAIPHRPWEWAASFGGVVFATAALFLLIPATFTGDAPVIPLVASVLGVWALLYAARDLLALAISRRSFYATMWETVASHPDPVEAMAVFEFFGQLTRRENALVGRWMQQHRDVLGPGYLCDHHDELPPVIQRLHVIMHSDPPRETI